MSNTESQEEESYALYTEKIVPKPTVKYKRLIFAAKFVLLAVSFGVIASITAAFVYPVIKKAIDIDSEPKEQLTIQKDEYPTEAVDPEGNAVRQTTVSDIDAVSDKAEESSRGISAFKNVAEQVLRSVVTIDTYRTDVDSILMEMESVTESVGIIIGQVNGEYIILTGYQFVNDASSLVVKLTSATEVTAQIIGSSETAGIAIVSIKESDIPSNERAALAIAELDNSYNVKQGDIVIAAGKLYGQSKAIDYGVVSGITAKSGIDSSYEIINTGLAYSDGDYGYLFNSAGNVIGISVSVERKTFAATGISDLKSMIEELSNGNRVVYFGIRAQNVTGTMATLYGLPVGIYVTEVELDSPAYLSGLQPGDIITEIDGNMVLTIQAFSEKLYQCGGDREIHITAKRFGNGEYKEMTFTGVTTVR